VRPARGTRQAPLICWASRVPCCLQICWLGGCLRDNNACLSSAIRVCRSRWPGAAWGPWPPLSLSRSSGVDPFRHRCGIASVYGAAALPARYSPASRTVHVLRGQAGHYTCPLAFSSVVSSLPRALSPKNWSMLLGRSLRYSPVAYPPQQTPHRGGCNATPMAPLPHTSGAPRWTTPVGSRLPAATAMGAGSGHPRLGAESVASPCPPPTTGQERSGGHSCR
jgi:hypothetical protein